MKTEKITEIQARIDNFINYLNKQNYSKCSIERFTYHLSLFKDYCIQNQRYDYISKQVFSDYISSILDYPEYKIKFASRVLNKFMDYSLTGSIHFSYKPTNNTLQNSEFYKILTEFKEQLSYSEIKISSQNKQIRTTKLFLKYLEGEKINSLQEMSIQNIYQFINNPKFSVATKSGYSHLKARLSWWSIQRPRLDTLCQNNLLTSHRRYQSPHDVLKTLDSRLRL